MGFDDFPDLRPVLVLAAIGFVTVLLVAATVLVLAIDWVGNHVHIT